MGDDGQTSHNAKEEVCFFLESFFFLVQKHSMAIAEKSDNINNDIQ